MSEGLLGAIGRLKCWLGRHDWVEVRNEDALFKKQAFCTREGCDEERNPMYCAAGGTPDYPEEFE